MANHGYARTGKPLNPLEVDMYVRKIVKEKLQDVFEVEFKINKSYPYGVWTIDYPEHEYIGLIFWISDEFEYGKNDDDGEYIEYKKPKLLSKQSVIEFRHGHAFNFLWWVEGVIRENLGKIYSANMTDDADDEDRSPKPEDFETFKTYNLRSVAHLKQDTEESKQEVREILKARKALRDKLDVGIPTELIKKFDLDFKID